MAYKSPWSTGAAPAFDLSKYGINSDYSSAPFLAQQPVTSNAGFEVPKIDFGAGGAAPPAGFTGGFSDIGSMGDFSQWGKNAGLFDSIDGKGMKLNGSLSTGLGIAQAGMGAYLGLKNYGLAKDSLAQSKDQFDKNYAAQRTMTNGRASDVYAAKNASSPGSAGTRDEFMKTHGIA